jgi:hypothetical protein
MIWHVLSHDESQHIPGAQLPAPRSHSSPGSVIPSPQLLGVAVAVPVEAGVCVAVTVALCVAVDCGVALAVDVGV